ncbi:MAG: cyclophilin-like fold protein [Candidatus Omnitrophica bacterium]|nr:cyclophilin-like fold protein [Candidatus Omnitrophota bacterium]
MKALLVSKDIQIEVEFNSSESARKIYASLPLKGKLNWWEEEIYFYVPLKLNPKDLTEEVKVGDFAYWPEGPALCIFLGRTPLSTDDKPRPASPVVIIGKVDKQDFSLLKKIKSGQIIEVRKRDGSN